MVIRLRAGGAEASPVFGKHPEEVLAAGDQVGHGVGQRLDWLTGGLHPATAARLPPLNDVSADLVSSIRWWCGPFEVGGGLVVGRDAGFSWRACSLCNCSFIKKKKLLEYGE